MAQRGFLLFSGYNIRAVVALCRLFTQTNTPFFMIAAGHDDPILKTAYAHRVVHKRASKVLSLSEIGEVIERIRATQAVAELVYCPTSEFLNQFLLDHQGRWPEGLLWPGVTAELYHLVTSKWLLGRLFQDRNVLPMPAAVDLDEPQDFPFVLKPKQNVAQGKTLYPLFITSPEHWRQLRPELDVSLYFAQQYLDGQSHYLCFYMAESGEVEAYGQVNLIQQPGGKSIVFARAEALSRYPIAEQVVQLLRSLSYRGPIMIELMELAGQFYFIEANPRFWGPLQLAFSANPRFFELFLKDVGADVSSVEGDDRHYYAWYQGYRHFGSSCRVYPGGPSDFTDKQLEELMFESDVFHQEDTLALFTTDL